MPFKKLKGSSYTGLFGYDVQMSQRERERDGGLIIAKNSNKMKMDAAFLRQSRSAASLS